MIAAFILLSLASAPVLAHHSFAAEYDSKKPVELKGTVTKLEWINPHAWIHMDVKDETGKVTSWACELGSPNLLMRNGWRRDSLKAGDEVIVNGSAAKDGSHIANARTVKMADGRRVFNAGSSGEQNP
jgi:hypothetical protein